MDGFAELKLKFHFINKVFLHSELVQITDLATGFKPETASWLLSLKLSVVSYCLSDKPSLLKIILERNFWNPSLKLQAWSSNIYMIYIEKVWLAQLDTIHVLLATHIPVLLFFMHFTFYSTFLRILLLLTIYYVSCIIVKICQHTVYRFKINDRISS